MWHLKYDTNGQIYKTETGSQTWRTDLWLPAGDEGSDWDQQMQTRVCRMDEHKVLLDSTGNQIQYPAVNHNAKDHAKEYMYV